MVFISVSEVADIILKCSLVSKCKSFETTNIDYITTFACSRCCNVNEQKNG